MKVCKSANRRQRKRKTHAGVVLYGAHVDKEERDAQMEVEAARVSAGSSSPRTLGCCPTVLEAPPTTCHNQITRNT